MKLFQQLRYNTRVAILLAVLLVCLLLNNIINQANFGSMEKAATSIYEDRLLPSTYIFEIREYLYKHKALTQAGMDDNYRQQMAHQYKAAVLALVDKYGHTILTKQEAVDLRLFKSNLNGVLSSSTAAQAREVYFERSLNNLHDLLEIQSGEGKHLKADMNSIVRVSAIISYLEAGLLIVIGGITLSLIGFSKNIFRQKALQDPSLN